MLINKTINKTTKIILKYAGDKTPRPFTITPAVNKDKQKRILRTFVFVKKVVKEIIIYFFL